ncbi:archaeal flavoprotein [Piscinibacter sakaiensis]|uniref:Archaeal flavoprotein n=1 Tax=Piscinibacter sakaiensis TaxID=1547922 RepID=A0A0K8P566_PISS1|nr:archaeal flavoprotein [Piscinibacter sakaiensis]
MTAAPRFAWAVTGSGHELEESLALAARLPDVDLFLSAAAEEVLPMYGRRLEALRRRFRVVRDKTASAVPVGALYAEAYHTLVVAPATSNTVAKCAVGISDSLPTNLYAQAGKLGIPSLVYACDTEPVVVTRAPHDWVTLRPRRIELRNVALLREFEATEVLASAAELEAALGRRLAALGLAWLPAQAAADFLAERGPASDAPGPDDDGAEGRVRRPGETAA